MKSKKLKKEFMKKNIYIVCDIKARPCRIPTTLEPDAL